MADYERLVKELNAKLLEKDEYVEELKAQICTLTQREETLKQEIGLYRPFSYTKCLKATQCCFLSPVILFFTFLNVVKLLKVFLNQVNLDLSFIIIQ